MNSPRHAISFDVEEYFQVANFSEQFPRDSWDEQESRLDVGMERIFGALERHRTHATFFFLGWIAERHPAWVTRCLEAGHEVASHGYDHQFLWDLGETGFDEDLARTEQALAAAGAGKPKGFRACTFTVTERSWWAFDVLTRRGYEYDSSVHPVRHPVYGVPGFEPGLSRVSSSDGKRSLVELPVSTYPLGKRNLPAGGGGYFRLYPLALTRAVIRKLERLQRPAAFYFHPWEFDPDQPRVDAPWSKRFRHYVGLSKTLPRLEALLLEFDFGSFEEVVAAELARGVIPTDG
jgi:polysaccharide deacetylase family protein (PEP-CTERM system associated)